MSRAPFGTTRAGEAVEKITLAAGDLSVSILALGAILQDVRLAGMGHALTLGSDDLGAYDGGPMAFYGAIVGPVANRIAGARCSFRGGGLRFEANEGGATSLHGGHSGTYAHVWDIVEASETTATLRLALADGLGGYPGNRVITARFEVRPPATLRLTLEGLTDAPSLMNLANHSYWNLAGTPEMAGQNLTVHADRYTPIDAALIPTGVAPVAGTDFDLQSPAAMGPGRARIDHNFCLTGADGSLREALVMQSETVEMRIATDQPGLQVYDAGEQDSAPHRGHSGAPYGAFCGMALEPQLWPDAPNQPGFPSAEITPERPYRQVSEWRFSRR